jgi:hypothetical protein
VTEERERGTGVVKVKMINRKEEAEARRRK